MSTTAIIKNQSEFRQGFQSGISIAIGYLPIALTFGLLAKTTGLTFVETVLMSLIVFAGAAQYISLSLIAMGTGVFEIVLTTFIVNIRHFLMTASLNEKAEKGHPLKRAIYAFGVTDETFAVAATKDGSVSTPYMFGVTSISYASWVICSGVGFLVGANLPETLQVSMSIALYAMFIGLLVPSMKKQRKVIFLAGVAAVCNSIFLLIFHFSTGWSIVSATLISALVVELVANKLHKGGDMSE